MNPYLSVVATSRNDDHGGDPLIRTQIFVTNFARQCEKYKLPAELIIVDWNPVPDRPGLAAVLKVPDDTSFLQARVVTVPTTLHQRIKYSEKLPLFQMIAKNVGIRRARGEFILATNIDILFSDELMQFIGRQKLNPLKQYRVDRYDIHSGLSPDLSLDETLDYAWANPIRTNRRYLPEKLVNHLYGDELFRRKCVPEPEFREWNEGVEVVNEEGTWQVRPERKINMTHLHTNACGDFTLLSRKGWDAIRGYAEFAAYSFNIDSLGMVAAHYAGYTEVALLPPCVCFHIEHGIGSGWTPEGEKKLFSRLREAGILNPEWPVLTPLVDQMREESKALNFNHSGWGMVDFDLPEQAMGDRDKISEVKLKKLEEQASVRELTAIEPAYDLDRLTLTHERRVVSNFGLSVIEKNWRDIETKLLDVRLEWHDSNVETIAAGAGKLATIITPAEAWQYGGLASIVFEELPTTQRGLVRLLVSVRGATAGIGFTNNNVTNFLKRVEVPAKREDQEITFLFENLAELNNLVVQTWAQSKSATVTVLDFTVQEIPKTGQNNLPESLHGHEIPPNNGNGRLDNSLAYVEQAVVDEQIASILSSTSWRVTSPLRYVGDKLKKIRRVQK